MANMTQVSCLHDDALGGLYGPYRKCIKMIHCGSFHKSFDPKQFAPAFGAAKIFLS